MRSGTTIIHEMLSRFFPRAIDIESSDIEGRVFWQRRGFNIGSPRTGTRCDAYDRTAVTEAQMREMRAYVRRREAGDRHIVNKNPHLCNKIGLLDAVFPDARIVHLVRDQLAVAASVKLRLLAAHEGKNILGTPFVHYWPEDATWPCWFCVPDGSSGPGRDSLKRRLRRLVLGPRKPMGPHQDAAAFRRLHPDPSRYYPGAGFRRIPEYWLRVNANIVRQVQAAGIQGRYLAVTYADLVARTRDTLARIAAFAGIDRAAPDAVPASLDGSRHRKWREHLSAEEQRCVAAVTEEFAADASLIRGHLPGEVFTSPA
jgi:hypothetical protein